MAIARGVILLSILLSEAFTSRLRTQLSKTETQGSLPKGPKRVDSNSTVAPTTSGAKSSIEDDSPDSFYEGEFPSPTEEVGAQYLNRRNLENFDAIQEGDSSSSATLGRRSDAGDYEDLLVGSFSDTFSEKHANKASLSQSPKISSQSPTLKPSLIEDESKSGNRKESGKDSKESGKDSQEISESKESSKDYEDENKSTLNENQVSEGKLNENQVSKDKATPVEKEEYNERNDCYLRQFSFWGEGADNDICIQRELAEAISFRLMPLTDHRGQTQVNTPEVAGPPQVKTPDLADHNNKLNAAEAEKFDDAMMDSPTHTLLQPIPFSASRPASMMSSSFLYKRNFHIFLYVEDLLELNPIPLIRSIVHGIERDSLLKQPYVQPVFKIWVYAAGTRGFSNLYRKDISLKEEKLKEETEEKNFLSKSESAKSLEKIEKELKNDFLGEYEEKIMMASEKFGVFEKIHQNNFREQPSFLKKNQNDPDTDTESEFMVYNFGKKPARATKTEDQQFYQEFLDHFQAHNGLKPFQKDLETTVSVTFQILTPGTTGTTLIEQACAQSPRKPDDILAIGTTKSGIDMRYSNTIDDVLSTRNENFRRQKIFNIYDYKVDEKGSTEKRVDEKVSFDDIYYSSETNLEIFSGKYDGINTRMINIYRKRMHPVETQAEHFQMLQDAYNSLASEEISFSNDALEGKGLISFGNDIF